MMLPKKLITQLITAGPGAFSSVAMIRASPGLQRDHPGARVISMLYAMSWSLLLYHDCRDGSIQVIKENEDCKFNKRTQMHGGIH